MKEDKRRAILDAAMGVFSRKGYHAASIQEIAEEAGVAKGSVYLYFKSKDELALFALQHACEQIAQRVKEAALERGLPARERFVRQLPSTSVEASVTTHWVAARRNAKFPSGYNSALGVTEVRIGANYYFDMGRLTRKTTALPPTSRK